MVLLDLPALMRCAEAGCKAVKRVELVLTAPGGFGFRPKGDGAAGWQVTVDQQGVFVCFCPEHVRKVVEASPQIGPAGPGTLIDGQFVKRTH